MRRRLLLPLMVPALALLAAAPSYGAEWSAPRGVTATTTHDGNVDVAWQPVPGAVGYQVYRTRSASAMDEAVTTFAAPAASTSSPQFTDTSARDGSQYYYAVKAVGVGTSPASDTARVTARVADCNGTNPIVVENCLPGNANWKAVGSPGGPAQGIEGYATSTSIEAGQSVDLKVNSSAPYTVEIYRSGWYGGDQGRLVSTLPDARPATLQPACQSQAETGLIDCANWSTSATLTTTSDWVSGVYLIRLVRTDNQNSTHVLLTVRGDRACSDLTYVTPVTTYQAYNNWGGTLPRKSAYDFNSSGDNTVAGSRHAVKVSFNRPYTQDPPERNWYTEVDVQNVSWLERQGYNLNYVTSVDLHAGIPFMTYRKALISASHDEYWSAEMRQAATTARDSGMGLFFLGSNAVYWKIAFENNNRYMAIYKSTQGPSGADSAPTTSTWRDHARANQPENALVGQQYIGDNDNGTFPLRIDYQQAQNPIWRHTILRDLLPGGSDEINGLVGWEWDAKTADQGPDAEIFAASAVNGMILQDAGSVYAPGNAVQNSTSYVAPSGALVVATGTNYWSRGLGQNIRGVGTPHPVVFQATVNGLRDMDTAPTTPSEGMVVDPGASPPRCPPPPPSPPDPGPGPGGTDPGPGGTDTTAPPPSSSPPGSSPAGQPPTRTGKKPAGLRITSIKRRGTRLLVTGTIVRSARGRLKVSVGRRTANAVIRNGRWSARIRINRRARRVSVRVAWAGNAEIQPATITRKARLRTRR